MHAALRLAVHLTAFVVLCALSVAWARVPLEAFAGSSSIGRPKISPDGKRVAAPRWRKSGDIVLIYGVDDPPGTKVTGVTLPENIDVDWVYWANDDRLLIAMSKGLVSRIVSVDGKGQNMVVLFANSRRFRGNRNLSQIIHDLPDDPDAVLMAADDSNGRYGLYRVNVNDGKAELVTQGKYNTFQWLTDLKGAPRVRWDYRPRRDLIEIYLRDGDTADWNLVAEYGDRDLPDLNLVGFGDDPRVILVASRQATDRYGIFEFDMSTRKRGAQVFAHPRVDVGDPVGGPIYDPATTKLLGVYYVDDLRETHYFDPDMALIQQRMDATFSGASHIEPYAWSRDRMRVLVRVEGSKDPGTYHLFDRKREQVTLIARTHPDIPPTELGEVVIIKYKARDGTKIPGYLTMPPGKGDKNLPMVVMPHGGPELRDYVQYDQWPQMLANRGYVVFQPNFRGSGGYGRAFAEAGHRQWGRLMQDDITDGVKALIDDGTVDPNRVCIAGASYGGYAALAGGAFTPDLYKCVVSIAGVSDIPAMLEEEEDRFGDESSVYQYWVKRLGDPRTDLAQMKAVSPALQAANFKVPVLLIHGTDDGIVPIDQSKRMDKALKAAGKQVEFVIIEDEGHNFSKKSSDIKVMSQLERFFAAHIGN